MDLSVSFGDLRVQGIYSHSITARAKPRPKSNIMTFQTVINGPTRQANQPDILLHGIGMEFEGLTFRIP